MYLSITPGSGRDPEGGVPAKLTVTRFHKEHKKLTDEEPTPLMPKNHEGRSEKFPPSLK
jgi:hypothetical protein